MSDDEGYVHDPAAFREGADEGGTPETDAGAAGVGDATPGAADAAAGAHPDAADREFDWRGWTLVVAILFAFVVVPAALYFLPRAQGFVASLGLTLRDAYLVLPLLPALVLGALAVWATTRP